jgi:hypothetical protein
MVLFADRPALPPARNARPARAALPLPSQEQFPEGLTVSLRLLRANKKGRTIGRPPDGWE